MATRGPGPLKYFRVCASDKKYSDPFKVTATTPTGHFFFLDGKFQENETLAPLQPLHTGPSDRSRHSISTPQVPV